MLKISYHRICNLLWILRFYDIACLVVCHNVGQAAYIRDDYWLVKAIGDCTMPLCVADS